MRAMRTLAAGSLLMAGTAQGIIITQSQNAMTAGLGASAPGSWNGVGKVGSTAMGFGCTGTVIRNQQGVGMWVLTAAHCMFDSMGNPIGQNDVTFNLPEPGLSGTTYFSQSYKVNPGYNPNTLANDIALIKLGVNLAPLTTAYDYNRGQIPNEIGPLTYHKVGYGYGGDGANGTNPALFPYGTKREGNNKVDVYNANSMVYTDGLGNMVTIPGNTLLYDFDNHVAGTNGPLGGPANGTIEATVTPGDSGGPGFLFDFMSGQFIVAGVTSGITDGGNLGVGAARFGNICLDTRVLDFSGWITMCVPAPSSASLLLGAGLAAWRRRR